MQYSPHQLAYFAHQLTRRAAADFMDRMAGALLDAQVDLNPHQIEAFMSLNYSRKCFQKENSCSAIHRKPCV